MERWLADVKCFDDEILNEPPMQFCKSINHQSMTFNFKLISKLKLNRIIELIVQQLLWKILNCAWNVDRRFHRFIKIKR